MVLPGIRHALPVNAHYDLLALILETRVLRPLAGFGLAERQDSPRAPAELIAHAAYRKAPLFDRVVSFHPMPDPGASGARAALSLSSGSGPGRR